MITPQFSLDLNRELFVDNFAGGGGASTGIERALGRHVDHAINHDKEALGMHRINNPQTIHHCEDVFDIDPVKLTEGRPVGGAWFSPDCKHFSKAKGGKPLSKKIRGLAFVILRWAKIRTRVIYMENVEEIQTWGPLLDDNKPDPAHKGRTWQSFLQVLGNGVASDCPDLDEMLEVLNPEGKPATMTRNDLVRGFGYNIETREFRAYLYGAPTIRKRLYLVARCDGLPIVWPKPTHERPEIASAQRLKPWRIVAECIDWDIPCNSIFLTLAQARAARCRRPLAKSTLRRVAMGVDRYVLKAARPFLVSLTHQGGDRVESIDEPVKTLTGAHRGEKALVDVKSASFVTEHANASNQRNMPVDEPSRTLCAEVKGGHFALVSAHMLQKGHLKSNSQMTKGADEPMRTQATRGEHAVIAASLTRFNGNHQGRKDGDARNQSPENPITTQDTSNRHALVAANLVKLRGANIGHPASEPGHTVSAGGTHLALGAAYLAQHNGGFNTNPGHAATDPSSTISGKGSQQQVVIGSMATYYGSTKDGQATDGPLHTVTTKERFGFIKSDAVAPVITEEQIVGAHRVAKFLRSHGVEFEGEFATVCGFVIVDIGMRMLTPRELFRAQGFPESYVIDRAWVINPKNGETTEVRLTKEQQIRMCGNSVCPDVAEALVRANSADMAIPIRRRKKSPIAIAA